MTKNKQIIIFTFIIALIFTFFGFLIGLKIKRVPAVKEKLYTRNEALELGLQEAYQRLLKRGQAATVVCGYGFRASKNIGGVIKEINNDQIIIKVDPVNPLADPALDQRIVKINKNTKIYKQIEKTSQELDQEMKEFDEKMKEFKEQRKKKADQQIKIENLPQPPKPLKKIEINLSELKIKNRIIVNADYNIHNQKEFNAKEIILQR